MQAADTPEVEEAVQAALRFESWTVLSIAMYHREDTLLTVNDARRIIACLENPRFDTLIIRDFDIRNDAVLDVLRNGLPLCTSVTTVILEWSKLGNEDLNRLRPAFYNTSVRILSLYGNNIQGQRGCEVLRDLLDGNDTLLELNLDRNPIGPEGSIGLGWRGLAGSQCLQKINLNCCSVGSDSLANLLPADGTSNNNSLMDLNLGNNNIEGAEGGRQLSLLLQRFPALKVLRLNYNNLGPLGAQALAPGLAASASHLESLGLYRCGLGNEGVAHLVPEGHVNRSLTHLDISGNNIQGRVGGENVRSLLYRCINLDSLDVSGNFFSPDQQRRLESVLDRKRLCTEASALGGSTFSVLFRFVEKAHHHEHGLSAIFVILQDDGDDYFCTALNRAIE